MFLIILKYEYGLDKVLQNLDEHNKFLKKYYDLEKFICSGPQNPRTGGIILCKASSKEEVEKIIAEDPFKINKAVEYEIIEFEAKMCAKGFEKFL